MTVHDFNERRKWSETQADQPWWREVYTQAFPGLQTMACIRDDGWAQRAGIDRVLTLASGRTVKVDEKVRERVYPDILLERWSDRDRKTPGWIQKHLDCDYIAYAFVPSRRCYLLPFLDLQRAWWRNGREWIARFPTVEAQNRSWVTESIAVPIPTLLDALGEALAVSWGEGVAA